MTDDINMLYKMRYINILQQFIKKCLKIYDLLPSFKNNKLYLSYDSINSFRISSKKNNDKNNKIRENIIVSIINNKVPTIYYNYSNRWLKLKNNITYFIKSIADENNININTTKIIHLGGRKYNYDFILYINDIPFNIELKFNVENIKETPQFNSPMKPSQYMSRSYEEFYYDNYLEQLSSYAYLQVPDKKTYLKEIHSIKPKCIFEHQKLYYQGNYKSSKFNDDCKAIEFYNLSKILSKESIEEFIKDTELNLIVLSEYLSSSQKNKIYMNYKNDKFYKVNININDYILVNYIKHKNYYEVTSKSGKILKVLLRWKNGNGIAFPAFQISIK